MSMTSTLAVLSSMITPVVLIMASGSLIMTTSQRLSRQIERTRNLTKEIKDLVKCRNENPYAEEEIRTLFLQLDRSTRRARLLQAAMTLLYLTVSIFVATSITLAVIDLSHARYNWIPIGLGIAGALLLFSASIVLIKESRLAITAVDFEMNNAISFFKKHFPDFRKSGKRSWWQRLLVTKKKDLSDIGNLSNNTHEA